MSNLTREAILARKPRLMAVEVEALGGTVRVRELSIGQILAIADRPKADQGPLTFVLSVCDEHGIPMFTEDDLPTIAQLPFEVMKSVEEAVVRHNKLGDAGKAEMGKA